MHGNLRNVRMGMHGIKACVCVDNVWKACAVHSSNMCTEGTDYSWWEMHRTYARKERARTHVWDMRA